MNTPRTRLIPGRPWVGSPGVLMSTADGRRPTAPPAGGAGGQTRWPPIPGSTPERRQGMPGVEVTELESDTVFDRLFGTLDQPPPSGA